MNIVKELLQAKIVVTMLGVVVFVVLFTGCIPETAQDEETTIPEFVPTSATNVGTVPRYAAASAATIETARNASTPLTEVMLASAPTAETPLDADTPKPGSTTTTAATVEQKQEESTNVGLPDTPYTSSSMGFQISPPHGWIVDVDEATRACCSLEIKNAVPDSYLGLSYTASIIITFMARPLEVPLIYHVEERTIGIPYVVSDFLEIRDHNETVNGKDAYFYEYFYVREGYPFINRHLYVNTGDGVYTLIASAFASEWEKYDEVFEASLLSFAITAEKPES